jgi:hypothetical protein
MIGYGPHPLQQTYRVKVFAFVNQKLRVLVSFRLNRLKRQKLLKSDFQVLSCYHLKKWGNKKRPHEKLPGAKLIKRNVENPMGYNYLYQ